MCHDRSRDCLWNDFGSILVPKILPKSVPRGTLKLFKIIAVFHCFLDRQKIDFLIHMAPTWPHFGPQAGSKLGPKWDRIRRHFGKIRPSMGVPGSPGLSWPRPFSSFAFNIDFRLPLDGSKTILRFNMAPNLGSFWGHVGHFLGQFWVLSWNFHL